MKLKISLTITLLLLIAIGFTACGDQTANNGFKTNANNNTGNANTSSANAGKTLTPPPCDSKTDDAIVIAMRAEVPKKPALLARVRHFNFYVKDCKVSLVGYMDDIGYFKELYALAASTPDVQTIEIKDLWLTKAEAGSGPVGGICPNNGVPCNDICLPEGQKCNTEGISQLVPSPTKTPKP